MFKKILLAGAAGALISLAIIPVAAAQPAGSFQQGLHDRTAWENWFAVTTGDYRAGAYWWSGRRSLVNPGSCGPLGGDATQGCLAAKLILDPFDAQRLNDPDYKMGWNSYTQPMTPAPTVYYTPQPPTYAAPPMTPPSYTPPATTEIVMRARGSDVFELLASVNDVPAMSFILDTGASDVALPRDVADRLMMAGALSPTDYQDTRPYSLADGRQVYKNIYRLHSITVGNVTVHDVLCSVGDRGSSLLIGQSFLHKFRSYSIDNERAVLTLGTPI